MEIYNNSLQRLSVPLSEENIIMKFYGNNLSMDYLRKSTFLRYVFIYNIKMCKSFLGLQKFVLISFSECFTKTRVYKNYYGQLV